MAAQREWFEKNYYEVLGVPESAPQKDITKAYRKLARQYHPDANPGNSAAEERFKDISAAYDVLGDEAKRKEYDERGCRCRPAARCRPRGGPHPRLRRRGARHHHEPAPHHGRAVLHV